jgi:selenoprotein W-related protein
LAAELKKSRGIDATLTKGSGGVLDVVVDGQLIFSKKQVGRFPEPGEIDRLLPAG